MASVDYSEQFEKMFVTRKTSGKLVKEDKRTVCDDVFTTANLITHNFLTFTPQDIEIRRFFEEKGEKISDILIEEYLEAIKFLMLQKIGRSIIPRAMNSCMRYAIESHVN